MDAGEWDARYAAAAAQASTVWSLGPNATIAELAAPWPPGRALDVAAGEGRNAIWLAEQGWQTTVLDFSEVATARAGELAEARLGAHADRVTTVTADVVDWPGWADAAAYDLVLVAFLHLLEAQRRAVHRLAAAAVQPGGRLVVLCHDRRNLAEGVGGPQDPMLLATPSEVVADLDGTGLRIDRAETLTRSVQVQGVPRHALDCLVVAVRPGESRCPGADSAAATVRPVVTALSAAPPGPAA